MKILNIAETEEKSLLKYLARVSFFAGLNKMHFKRIISSFELREYENDEVIIEKGDMGYSFFIVYAGKVGIFNKKFFFMSNTKIAELGVGELFGEISLLEGVPRTATVISSGTTKLFVLESRSIQKLFQENPSFRESLKKISETRKNT
jgi:CRP-like cAMP-binding protein